MLSIFVLTCIYQVAGGSVIFGPNGGQEDPGVTRLREYLRLKAVHPNPDYSEHVTLQILLI